MLAYLGARGNLKKPKMVENYNIGNFLKVIHIEKAFELINLQIEDDNFSFKTLEFEIYRKDQSTKNFDCQKFYDNLIEKDIFYNHNNSFFNIEYLIPKGVYGARIFNFLSFEMLILYYALGFYIFDLIKESYETIEIKKEKRKKKKEKISLHIMEEKSISIIRKNQSYIIKVTT